MSTPGSLKISQPGFKMHRRTGIAAGPGDRANSRGVDTNVMIDRVSTMDMDSIRLLKL